MSATAGLVIAALITSVAFAGLAVAAALALRELRRTAQTATETLAAVEREIRPLAADVHALLQEHRDLARQAVGTSARSRGSRTPPRKPSPGWHDSPVSWGVSEPWGRR